MCDIVGWAWVSVRVLLSVRMLLSVAQPQATEYDTKEHTIGTVGRTSWSRRVTCGLYVHYTVVQHTMCSAGLVQMKAHSLSFLTYASSHAFASLVFPFLPVRALLNCTVSLIWEGNMAR